jgi:hypothetical protein
MYSEARTVYKKRSEAVHGAAHYGSSELDEVNVTAEKLCVFALVSCASLFPAIMGTQGGTNALTESFKVAKLGGIEQAAARIGAVIRPIPAASKD